MNAIKLWLVANWPKLAAAAGGGFVTGFLLVWGAGAGFSKATVLGALAMGAYRAIGAAVAYFAPKKEVLVAAAATRQAFLQRSMQRR